MTTLLVDFNRMRGDKITASLQYADGPVSVGDRVTAREPGEMEAMATVRAVWKGYNDANIAELEVDRATFKDLY